VIFCVSFKITVCSVKDTPIDCSVVEASVCPVGAEVAVVADMVTFGDVTVTGVCSSVNVFEIVVEEPVDGEVTFCASGEKGMELCIFDCVVLKLTVWVVLGMSFVEGNEVDMSIGCNEVSGSFISEVGLVFVCCVLA